MALPVNICIDVPEHNYIEEITYDNKEIHREPLLMLENFTKLVPMIDFNSDLSKSTEFIKPVDINPSEQPARPWESVRNKLKATWTELNILHDVLNLAHQKIYMIVDEVNGEETPAPNENNLKTLCERQNSLAEAADILLNGAERLKRYQIEESTNENRTDFYSELLRLRKTWRINKVGSRIEGDLSYPGSSFTERFQVTKLEDNKLSEDTMEITLPNILQGISYIQIYIQEEEVLSSARITIPNRKFYENKWDRKLEIAQNILFCRELFARLSYECQNAPIPHLLEENQIKATLFPGIQIIITLIHSSSQEQELNTSLTQDSHDPVLEHSLHQLLQLRNYPLPHPASGQLGLKRLRLAGPEALNRQKLLEVTNQESILEQIVKQAQHSVLRLKTMRVIDDLARGVEDVLIMTHWNSLTSPTVSCVKIMIVSQDFETNLIVHVREKTLKAICQDGEVIDMYEVQGLRRVMLHQVSKHRVDLFKALSEYFGWRVLTSSNNLGIRPVESFATASSVITASPNGNHRLILRCGSLSGVQVFIQSSSIRDERWENLYGNCREIQWDEMEGLNFFNNAEMLLASLTNYNYV